MPWSAPTAGQLNYRLRPKGQKQAEHAVAFSWLSRIPVQLYCKSMNRSSSIAERVEAIIRRMEGTPLCDECITDRLDLSSVAQASAATGAAGGVGGFERLKAACGLCGEQRHVIRYKS